MQTMLFAIHSTSDPDRFKNSCLTITSRQQCESLPNRTVMHLLQQCCIARLSSSPIMEKHSWHKFSSHYHYSCDTPFVNRAQSAKLSSISMEGSMITPNSYANPLEISSENKTSFEFKVYNSERIPVVDPGQFHIISTENNRTLTFEMSSVRSVFRITQGSTLQRCNIWYRCPNHH